LTEFDSDGYFNIPCSSAVVSSFPAFFLVTIDDCFPVSFDTVHLTSAFEIAYQTADLVIYHLAVQMGRKDLEFRGLSFTFDGFYFCLVV
jgi:hypothetical protein